MSMSDTLGDMLTRIRNAQRAKKSEVVSPASRLRESVLEVLKKKVTLKAMNALMLSRVLMNFTLN